jgi:hypothetical protein
LLLLEPNNNACILEGFDQCGTLVNPWDAVNKGLGERPVSFHTEDLEEHSELVGDGRK